MVLANSAALKFCGIDASVADVEGGEILRNPDGSLTGLFKDNAMNLLLDRIPPMTDAQRDRAFAAAADYFLANGVTSVHDVDGLSRDFASVETARRRLASGKPTVRLYAATPLAEWKQLLSAKKQNDKWIKTGALKGFVDGSLGSHTAAFHRDYSDKAGDKGFFINPEPRLHEWISGADSAGLHVMVHAIGDSAIHTLLDIYERVIEENGPRDRRFRIEHAQHLAPDDIPRFKKLGVIASMQPYHAIDDGRWAEDYLGPERIKTTYAFHSLANAGAHLAFGSDWAVAPADPLAGIRAAVYRRTLDGANPEGWVPEQRISTEEALIAYTRGAAFAGFAENLAGTLVQGKFADFVVLSGDILNGGLDSAQVVRTYVGGVKAY
jgi:predicted amidohydrolase YtcJ